MPLYNEQLLRKMAIKSYFKSSIDFKDRPYLPLLSHIPIRGGLF
jgi:hypothetical protein